MKGGSLLLVAVQAVDGCNGTEETIVFAIDSGGEEQRVGRSGGSVVGKGERPESVDSQDGIVGILHEAHEFVGEAVESSNPATAEVADENGVTELTEVARGPDNAPRRVEPGTMRKMANIPAGGCEEFNKAEPVASDVIVPGGVLLGVSDEQNSADVLNVERRETLRNPF